MSKGTSGGGRRRLPITPERRDQIIALIDRWKPEWGRLTGPGLELQVKNLLGISLSRPGMLNHRAIEKAYMDRRTELESGKPSRKRLPADENLLLQRIKRLENDKAEIEAEKTNLLELIARHHFNAQRKGMTIAALEAPLNQARAETKVPTAVGGKGRL